MLATQDLRPFVVLGRCWLQEEIELAPGLAVEPLDKPLSFENEVNLVLTLADRLGIKPTPDYHRAARARLDGTEPTALMSFPSLTAADFNDAVSQLEPLLELAYDSLAFLTTNAVVPIAIVLVSTDDTFRARFLPPDDRALIHIGDRPVTVAQIHAAAQSRGELAVALFLLRSGAQARTRDYQIFHYVQALEVLSETLPGGGTLAVKIRRLLDRAGLAPPPTPSDPSKDFADVLGELRNVVAHGNRLGPASVKPWARSYLAEKHLEIVVRDLARDVIERLARPQPLTD